MQFLRLLQYSIKHIKCISIECLCVKTQLKESVKKGLFKKAKDSDQPPGRSNDGLRISRDYKPIVNPLCSATYTVVDLASI